MIVSNEGIEYWWYFCLGRKDSEVLFFSIYGFETRMIFDAEDEEYGTRTVLLLVIMVSEEVRSTSLESVQYLYRKHDF